MAPTRRRENYLFLAARVGCPLLLTYPHPLTRDICDFLTCPLDVPAVLQRLLTTQNVACIYSQCIYSVYWI